MNKEDENSINLYDYEQQIIIRQRKRAEMRRKRLQRRRRILLVTALLAVITFITIICFMLRPKPNKNSDILNGVWKYDEYTKYEFENSGNGCMCLDNVHYKHTYSIKGNKLTLDFEDKAVHDCTYTFTVEENKLTLKGEDGTVGGTYNLTKENN